MKNIMKNKIGTLFIMLILACVGFGGSACTYEPGNYAKDGLDLAALSGMVRKAKNAEDLETKLNAPESINNLDLDENDEVDYINVTEFGDSSTRGFSLTVDVAGEVQEVASVNLQNAGLNRINFAAQGNENIYGNNSRYEDSFDLKDAIFYTWMFNGARPNYVSLYHNNVYPVNCENYKN